MKPSRLKTVLESLLAQRWPAFVWGPPGIGKSSIVRAIAAERGLPVVDLRASLLDPTDLRGIPAIEAGRAVWCPPAFLPQSGQPPGILFLDEINAAPPLVQAGLYQLVLDRRVGEYELPAGWWIVAAGNRAQDRAVTFRMSSALANRFVHLELEADVEDWRAWALQRRIEPLVTSFIGVRPQLLCQEQDDAHAAYPTPRSWEMASDVIATFRQGTNTTPASDAASPPERRGTDGAAAYKACADVLPGIVGPAAAVEFAGFVKKAINERQLQAIVDDPHQAPLPQALDGLYLLTSWLAHQAAEEAVSRASAVLLTRLPPEFAVVLARDMIKARPAFMREPGYREFMRQHGHLVQR